MSFSDKLREIIRRFKGEPPPCAGAVIVAAGMGSRMGGANNGKALLQLAGRPLISYTLSAFEQAESIDTVVLVAREEDIPDLAEVCKQMGFGKVCRIVRGGASRPESVRIGVSELPDRCTFAAIHDGARPLCPPSLIDETVAAAMQFGAAAPGLPLHDTIKRVDGQSKIRETLDRNELVAIQTPQVFAKDLYLGALQTVIGEGAALTDDCLVYERTGRAVHVVRGSERNRKVTTPEDLALVEAMLEGGLF